jgi:hypothetical protein
MNSLSCGRKLPIFYDDEVIGFGRIPSSQDGGHAWPAQSPGGEHANNAHTL